MQKKPDFETSLPSKWVLCGEHSVLRGFPAIAIADPTCRLFLRAWNEETMSFDPPELGDLILGAVQKAGYSLRSGHFEIKSDIPLGAGRGSSAALCVAVARYLKIKDTSMTLSEEEVGTLLENTFHGISSGMDIAAVSRGGVIQYQRSGERKIIESLQFKKLPEFTLHDSGERISTRACIEKVKGWISLNPVLAKEMDAQMGEATFQCRSGLEKYDSLPIPESLDPIIEGMKLAQNCFETWGLITPKLQELQRDLLQQGALATKVTGAGLGGMVIALWKDRKEVNSHASNSRIKRR